MLCIPPHQARDFAPGNHNLGKRDGRETVDRTDGWMDPRGETDGTKDKFRRADETNDNDAFAALVIFLSLLYYSSQRITLAIIMLSFRLLLVSLLATITMTAATLTAVIESCPS